MTGTLLVAVYLTILIGFLGFDVLGKVAPTARPALLASMGALGGTVLIAVIDLPAVAGAGPLLPAAGAALASAALVGGFVGAWRALGGRKR